MLENRNASEHFQLSTRFLLKETSTGNSSLLGSFDYQLHPLNSENLPRSVWVPLSCSVAWKLPQDSKMGQL